MDEYKANLGEVPGVWICAQLPVNALNSHQDLIRYILGGSGSTLSYLCSAAARAIEKRCNIADSDKEFQNIIFALIQCSWDNRIERIVDQPDIAPKYFSDILNLLFSNFCINTVVKYPDWSYSIKGLSDIDLLSFEEVCESAGAKHICSECSSYQLMISHWGLAGTQLSGLDNTCK